jgi:hypothetical protein
MSFGQTDPRLNGHIADLRRQAGQARTTRPGSPSGRVSGHMARHAGALGVRDRIGVRLVELGLHLMVRTGTPSSPTAYRDSLLTRSSAARGR